MLQDRDCHPIPGEAFFIAAICLYRVFVGVGDGKTVKVLKDNWIPRFLPEILKPISPTPDTTIVHCLIDEEMGAWNMENVHVFFSPIVAPQIL